MSYLWIMKLIAWVLAVCGFLVLSLTSAVRPTPAAYACTPDPDFDAIASSDVIVSGWVTGWQERVDIPSPFNVGEKSRDYKSLGVIIEVDRVFKGSPSPRVQAVDSYMIAGNRWVGSSCAAFGADPTGQYVILGLRRGEDGSLHPSSLRTFYIGDGPSGEGYDDAMRRLDGLRAILPPKTGSAGFAAGSRIY